MRVTLVRPWHDSYCEGDRTNPDSGGHTIRTFAVSLIGAAALTAGLLLLRQHKEAVTPIVASVPPGESVPGEISLERLRERGF